MIFNINKNMILVHATLPVILRSRSADRPFYEQHPPNTLRNNSKPLAAYVVMISIS